MEQSRNSRLTAVLLILIQCILYGIGDPISKSAYETVPVYSLLTLRYALALVLMLLIWGKRIMASLKKVNPVCWILPVFCMAGAYIVGNVALKYTQATTVAFIRSLPTIIAPLLAMLVYRKKCNLYHVPFQLLVIVGLYLLCSKDGIHHFGLGEICALMSAIFLAGSLVFGEKSLEFVDSVTLSALQAAASLALVIPCALIQDGGIELGDITPSIGGVILYLAVLCTITGYLLQNAALERAPAFLIALVQSVGPIMTALFSFIFLREMLSRTGVLGAVIILACVIGDTVLDYRMGKQSEIIPKGQKG